jgi:hypothetical protein
MSFNYGIENSRYNMNLMFDATFTVNKHIKITVATWMFNYCNICSSIRFLFPVQMHGS